MAYTLTMQNLNGIQSSEISIPSPSPTPSPIQPFHYHQTATNSSHIISQVSPIVPNLSLLHRTKVSQKHSQQPKMQDPINRIPKHINPKSLITSKPTDCYIPLLQNHQHCRYPTISNPTSSPNLIPVPSPPDNLKQLALHPKVFRTIFNPS